MALSVNGRFIAIPGYRLGTLAGGTIMFAKNSSVLDYLKEYGQGKDGYKGLWFDHHYMNNPMVGAG